MVNVQSVLPRSSFWGLKMTRATSALCKTLHAAPDVAACASERRSSAGRHWTTRLFTSLPLKSPVVAISDVLPAARWGMKAVLMLPFDTNMHHMTVEECLWAMTKKIRWESHRFKPGKQGSDWCSGCEQVGFLQRRGASLPFIWQDLDVRRLRSQEHAVCEVRLSGLRRRRRGCVFWRTARPHFGRARCHSARPFIHYAGNLAWTWQQLTSCHWYFLWPSACASGVYLYTHAHTPSIGFYR